LGLGIYPLSADLNFQMAKVFKSTNDNKTAGLYVAVAASYAPLYIDPVFDDLNLSDADAKQGLMNLSWGLYFARDNERALERFNQLHNSGISDSNIDRGRAFTLFRLAKYDEALPLLEKASKKEPDELLPIDEILPIPGTNQYWTLRYSAGSTIGWIQYHLGNYSKAESQFQTILKDNPFWIDALTGYGYALLKQNKNTDAESAFIKALAISPFYPDAIQGLELAKLE